MRSQVRVFKRPARITLFVFAVLTIGGPALAKRKDDVVVMKNGDRFTGEIKRLDHGILYFKASYMLQSVQLDWTQVVNLQSQDQFLVALKDGTRYSAHIEGSASEKGPSGTLRVNAEGKTLEVAQQDVVTIGQKEQGFWNQLHGSVDYGLSYTGANSTLNSALGATGEYQRSKDFLKLTTSSQFSSQSEGTNTNRYTFDGQYFRQISPNWFYGGLLDLLKSDQQDLDLRTTTGAAIGRTMVRTDRTSFSVFAGTVFSHEHYFPQDGTTEVRQNAEALVGANFYTFRFRVLDIRSSILLYPGLSDLGRVRLSSDSSLRIELVKDFYWDFHLYENFDSRPPVRAPRNDLGISTGLSWKF